MYNIYEILCSIILVCICRHILVVVVVFVHPHISYIYCACVLYLYIVTYSSILSYTVRVHEYMYTGLFYRSDLPRADIQPVRRSTGRR